MPIGNGDVDWHLGDKLQSLLNNPVTFRCVDLISQLFGQVKFLEDGEENDNLPIIKRLNNPNPFQSKQDMLREFLFFKYAYGWVYQKPLGASGKIFKKEPSAIYNLNPAKVSYDKNFATRLIFERNQIRDVNKKQFRYEENEQNSEFSIDEVIPFFDIANGLSEDFLLKAPSRLNSIQKNIKNIDVALASENKALSKAGRWIVSASNKGSGTGINVLQKGDKEDIERNFGKYGLGALKSDVVVTSANLDTNSLHIPMNQLGIAESVGNNAAVIRNHFGVPREMYNLSDTGGKYDSVEQAPIQLIQNVVQNHIDDFCNSYTSYFELDKPLTGDLSHLSVMQYIEDKKAEKALKLSTAIRNLTGSGVDVDMFLEAMGIKINE